MSEIVVLGFFWAPLWGHNSVNFHPMLKIRTVLKRGHYYLQFDINFFSDEIQKLGGFGPQIWTPISQSKIKKGGSNKDQIKGLQKFFQNMPKKISFSSEKSGPPLKLFP